MIFISSSNNSKFPIFTGFVLFFVTFGFNSMLKCNAYGCESSCQRGIDQALRQGTDFDSKHTRTTDDINSRLRRLENKENGVETEVRNLERKYSSMESHLQQNVSSLQRRVDEEIRRFQRDVNDQISRMQQNLTRRIDELSRGGSTGIGHSGSSSHNHNHHDHHHNNNNQHSSSSTNDLYYNITRRIDNLEFSKINTLTRDNDIWRMNFRNINSTVEKMKRCHC